MSFNDGGHGQADVRDVRRKVMSSMLRNRNREIMTVGRLTNEGDGLIS